MGVITLIREPDGRYTLVAKNLELDGERGLLVRDASPVDEPLSEGQRRAFYAKLNALIRGEPDLGKQEAKARMLRLAERQFERPIESVNDLTASETSWLLDRMDDEHR